MRLNVVGGDAAAGRRAIRSSARRRASSPSRSPTPASASRPRSSASSSRPSSRPTPAPAASTAAPASAWRSAASWPACSAARSSCAATPGVGSTFTLYLPLRYVGPTGLARAASRRRRRAGTSLRAAGRAGRSGPIEAVPDDREHVAARRADAADRRGRPALRAHPRRPRPRPRLQGAGRDARRRRAGAGAPVPADRDLARRLPARHARLDRAQPAEAGSRDAPHPGADGDARRGSPARPGARRVLVPDQAGHDRGAERRARAGSRAYASAAPQAAAGRRGQPGRAAAHLASCSATTTSTSSPPTPAPRRWRRWRSSRSTASCSTCGCPTCRGFEVLETISRDEDAGATCRSSSSPAASCRPRRTPGCARWPAASSSRASSRRSGCSTRPSLFLHRVTSRPAAREAEHARAAAPLRRGPRRQGGAGRRRRRPQHLRAQQRARAARHEGADGEHRQRGDRAARAHRRPVDRADGHHDAGDGRLPDDAARSARTRRSSGCRSSR